MTEYTKRELELGYTYKWKPKVEDGIELKITKSSLGQFLFCPAAYNYSYREQIRGAVSDAMIKGNKVHDSEEAFWNNMDIKKGVEILKEDEVTAEDSINKYIRSLYTPTEHEGAEEIIDNMATFYTQEFISAYENDELGDFIPVGNEIMMDADVVFEGQSIHFQGIIDRLFQIEDHYVLMELKTGLWKDSKKTFMRKEMAYYKVLYEQSSEEQKIKFGLDPTIPIKQWGWYFPASNHIYIENCLTRSETGVWHSIQKLITAYYQDYFEYKWFYKKCIHCSHIDICEASAKQGEGHYDWF